MNLRLLPTGAAGVAALALLAAPAPAQKSGALPLATVEQKLLPGAYVDSLAGAQWVAARGARAVPALEGMLSRAGTYAQRAETGGAFPFNAVWALGRIPGPEAASALGRVRAAAKDPDLRTMIGHALAAHRLRAQKGPAHGVFGRGSLPELYAEPSTGSKVLQMLPQGQAVRVLKADIVNVKEEGPRGGPTEFDRVSLLPSGRTGYVQRAGDLFPSFY